MDPKTMKETVEEIDKKVLAYCASQEEALEFAVDTKPPVRQLQAGDASFVFLPPDGMDLTRAVYRQVLRARNLAWAIQHLPLLDLSFMSSMKRVEFEVQRRTKDAPEKIALTLPTWAATHYPPYKGHSVFCDPKSKIIENVAILGLTLDIPSQVVAENERAVGNEYLHPQAMIAEVPAALRRRIDPFVDRFDVVAVIGEADWKAVPGADPLVVGVIHSGRNERHAFLLGEYDPTKLEKYVIAELAVKPKE